MTDIEYIMQPIDDAVKTVDSRVFVRWDYAELINGAIVWGVSEGTTNVLWDAVNESRQRREERGI